MTHGLRITMRMRKSAPIEIPFRAGVRHSSPFVGQSPPLGRPFRQNHQPGFEVDAFDEMVAPMGEIYAPQTKISERRKKVRWVVLEALFHTTEC